VKASAPGKIILFGEHAVVYGRPALAVPVTQVHAEVELSESAAPGIWIDAPDIGLHAELNALPPTHPLAAVIHSLFSGLGIHPFPNLALRLTSTIPVASGLGSGAAVSVALVRALSAWLERPLSDAQVNAYAYDIEQLHHGTPSGIDNTVITYAKPVYFVKGQPLELLRISQPFTIVIGDTGLAAPTKASVEDVRRLRESDPGRWDRVFDRIGALTHQARTAMQSGDWAQLGALMNQNQALLQELTVSSPELDRLVSAALHAGALGAKLSGGGRGGNMIALVGQEAASDARQVERALQSAGALSTITTTISS
jgi:mevalonate kinase